MARKLLLNDPRKGTVNQIVRDIHTCRLALIDLRKVRGKPVRGFMTDLQDWLEWMGILEKVLREKLGMPKKDDRQIQWRGFIECKFTDSEKDLFTQWDVHDNDLFLLLSEAVSAGHKLSISFNKQNETYVASFTGNEGTDKHEGYTLSAYAGDWYIAVRALLFKHCVLLGSEWSSATERPTERLG